MGEFPLHLPPSKSLFPSPILLFEGFFFFLLLSAGGNRRLEEIRQKQEEERGGGGGPSSCPLSPVAAGVRFDNC